MKQLDAINQEIVIFSCICEKKNKFKFGSSERTFLITNLKVYNIEKSEIKRAERLEYVSALTKNIDPDNYNFIIHFD
jgi:hypothetical protein